MPPDASSELKVEIAHVLTMDVVAYSTLLITEQTRLVGELIRIVKSTARFQRAEAEGKLLRMPTGDGMLLVFFDDPQAPLDCAVEIAQAMKSRSEIRLRMGIHSGPVNEVVDVNDRSNVTGAGVDMAQRVMDCGDAGHILLSKRVADDLAPFPRWNPYLHELGACEVKHGRKVSLVNFYTSEIGNAEPPTKCRAPDGTDVAKRRFLSKYPFLIGAALFVMVIAAFVFSRTKTFQSWRSSAAVPANSHSIAVLPFENASNDPNVEYLSEGISEALINSLTELQQLRVIARATAFHYKGKDIDPRRVGRELQVAAVLTGKVRQMRDDLNVQVDLVDANTGAQLWGEGYDRKISDVIAVKQAIAREVAQQLKLKLSGEDQRKLVKRDTTNAEAYQFYLRGRYFLDKRTPDAIKQAIEQFQQAVERDPSFALGYTGLADSYLVFSSYAGVPSGEARRKARAFVDRALQLDDSLAEAHTSSAFTYQQMWQWQEAEREYRRAISLNDNYAAGHYRFCNLFLVRGELDEALKEIKRAQTLDPLSPIIGVNVVIILLNKNETNAAIEQCQKIIELDPNHPAGHDWLGLAYFQKKRYQEAIVEREKTVELTHRSLPQVGLLGFFYAIVGRREEALAILHDLESRYAKGEVVGQHLAMICEGLGERDQAFAWLEKDFQQHDAELQAITWRLQFEDLRHDRRYANLIQRMGLKP